MTFCLGMNLQGGLVGIADTRVIAGNERITARKVSVFQKERRAMFLMSSGLRSARDSHRIIQHRYEKEDLQDLSNVWQEGLRRSINNLSADWVEHAFDKLALPADNPSRLLPAPNGADRV